MEKMARICSDSTRNLWGVIIISERDDRICILNCTKAILSHALFQKDTALAARLRRHHTNRRDAPHTQSCPAKLGNIPKLLHNSPLGMNGIIRISSTLAPRPNTILSRGNHFAPLHNHGHMLRCIMRPMLPTLQKRRSMLLNRASKNGGRHLFSIHTSFSVALLGPCPSRQFFRASAAPTGGAYDRVSHRHS